MKNVACVDTRYRKLNPRAASSQQKLIGLQRFPPSIRFSFVRFPLICKLGIGVASASIFRSSVFRGLNSKSASISTSFASNLNAAVDFSVFFFTGNTTAFHSLAGGFGYIAITLRHLLCDANIPCINLPDVIINCEGCLSNVIHQMSN